MYIRKATTEDAAAVLKIFEGGRDFMRAHGNMNQWAGIDFPGMNVIEGFLGKEQLYVVDDEGEVIAAWAYILGEDPTYRIIESGSWLNDEPYGTIHRLASSGKRSHITEFIFDWALEQCPNLRGDTHADNYVMQTAAESFGFKMCGIIHLENGDPRIAYHVTKELRNKAKRAE